MIIQGGGGPQPAPPASLSALPCPSSGPSGPPRVYQLSPLVRAILGDALVLDPGLVIGAATPDGEAGPGEQPGEHPGAPRGDRPGGGSRGRPGRRPGGGRLPWWTATIRSALGAVLAPARPVGPAGPGNLTIPVVPADPGAAERTGLPPGPPAAAGQPVASTAAGEIASPASSPGEAAGSGDAAEPGDATEPGEGEGVGDGGVEDYRRAARAVRGTGSPDPAGTATGRGRSAVEPVEPAAPAPASPQSPAPSSQAAAVPATGQSLARPDVPLGAVVAAAPDVVRAGSDQVRRRRGCSRGPRCSEPVEAGRCRRCGISLEDRLSSDQPAG